MKVKKSLSMEDSLLKIAEDRAKELHLSFAAYITILINADLGNSNMSHPEKKKETEQINMSMFRSAMNNASAIMDGNF